MCSLLDKVRFLNEALFIDEYAFNETPYYERKLREAAEIMKSSRSKSGRHSSGMNFYNDHGDVSVKLDHFTELSLPEGVTHIDHWAYAGSIIESLYLPNSLRTLGMCAFKDCRGTGALSFRSAAERVWRNRLSPCVCVY